MVKYFLDIFKELSANNSTALVGQKKKYTWNEYYTLCNKFSKSILSNKISKNVAIMGHNTPEWFIAAVGSIMAGVKYAGIYPTNGPKEIEHIMSLADIDILVVSKLDLIKDVKRKVKLIVVYGEDPTIKMQNDIPIKTFSQFIGESSTFSPSNINIETDSIISYIFTSGTTSKSKAVKISYENISFTCHRMSNIYDLNNERIVSYLPLSHIAASMLDIFLHFYHRGTIYFAKPDALQGTLVDTLKDANPTVFLGVPRVWEKIMEKMKLTAEKKYQGTIGQILKKIMDYAKQKALEYHNANMNQNTISQWTKIIYNICSLLFFRKIKTAIGLNSCKFFLSGAAPISKEVLDYFTQIDIIIYELFGMSETCAIITGSGPGTYKKGSVGKALIGQVKIAKDGEILYYGKNNFCGYKDNFSATLETLDKSGWLHTGDIGTIDEEGFLFITGRKKELIITAGGENVAPVLIENEIKKYGPNISQVVVIGDKRKYLTALITIPKNNREYVEQAVNKYNENPISRAQKIQKFKILKEDFSIENDCMTPTMKLKRAVIAKKFENEINSMY